MRIRFACCIIILNSLVLIISCKKQYTPTDLNPYFNLKINGSAQNVGACGTTHFVAQYLGDSVVFAAFGCGGQRAGFYLKGVSDGTYQLNNGNKAWYESGLASYTTDSLNKGTLTITNKIFQLPNGGRIPIVEGKFSFDAIDKNTGQKIKVTSGEYLLKKF